jgi:hypothetical protein
MQTPQETTSLIMDKLADAAWDQLASLAPASLRIDEIARQAEVSETAARAVAGNVTSLILHQLARLDRQAILETLADIEDAGEVTIREKILEALMHRFEVYQPYKAQIARLDSAARRDLALGLRLLDSLAQAMRGLLAMAGDDLVGLRGEARVRGLAFVAMMAARAWQKDDSADMAATMNEIDKRLEQAEEWGRTLRVLGRGEGADDGHDADSNASDDGGADNDDNDNDNDNGGGVSQGRYQ